jgi:hypothetical protein
MDTFVKNPSVIGTPTIFAKKKIKHKLKNKDLFASPLKLEIAGILVFKTSQIIIKSASLDIPFETI